MGVGVGEDEGEGEGENEDEGEDEDEGTDQDECGRRRTARVDFKETTNLPVGGRDGGIDFIQRAQCTMHNARLPRRETEGT